MAQIAYSNEHLGTCLLSLLNAIDTSRLWGLMLLLYVLQFMHLGKQTSEYLDCR